MSPDPPDHPADAVPLDELVRDLGPLPGFLAADYGRQAAALLRAAHGRGRCHGDVRPAALLVRPTLVTTGPDGLTRRPAAGAVVVLADGPEAPDNATPADDLRGLGASLYFLLAGRRPAASPTPLAAVRPDLPADFAPLVHRLLAPDPAARPATAAEVEAALAGFARPERTPDPVPDSAPGWAADPFPSSPGGPGRPAERRPRTAGETARVWLLIALGLVLNLAAVGLAVAWLTGALDRRPDTTDEPAPVPKKADRPARVKKADPAKPDPDADDAIRD